MEQKDEKDLFEIIEGFTKVDPAAFEQFEKEMAEQVIPSIVEVVEERRVLAAESRHWQLKC